jgi:cobalt/nickel transport system permease protein
MMHIPDGFLSIPVITGTYSATILSLGFVRKKVKKFADSSLIPRIALLSAFIFVSQMINIPVAPGSSGHLIGAALATLLVGPYYAVVIMTMVVSVQMLIFQDGGVTAWGANVLNLSVIAVMVSYLVYFFARKWSKSFSYPGLRYLPAFLAAWLSVLVSSLFCGTELGLSGIAPLGTLLGLMGSVHALIGVMEGIMTVFILEMIRNWRRDILYSFQDDHTG